LQICISFSQFNAQAVHITYVHTFSHNSIAINSPARFKLGFSGLSRYSDTEPTV
jgi:hypothetical protein